MALRNKPQQSGGESQAQRTGHSGKWWVPTGAPVRGNDFLLDRPGGGFKCPSGRPRAWLARKRNRRISDGETRPAVQRPAKRRREGAQQGAGIWATANSLANRRGKGCDRRGACIKAGRT